MVVTVVTTRATTTRNTKCVYLDIVSSECIPTELSLLPEEFKICKEELYIFKNHILLSISIIKSEKKQLKIELKKITVVCLNVRTRINIIHCKCHKRGLRINNELIYQLYVACNNIFHHFFYRLLIQVSPY